MSGDTEEFSRKFQEHIDNIRASFGLNDDDENSTSLDGIAWHDAPIPPHLHRCHPQTTGWIGFDQIQRCPCGAIRNTRFRGWLEKNTRRKGERHAR